MSDRAFLDNEKFVQLERGYQLKSSTRPNGSQGDGVFVGIVDTGVNILHSAFHIPGSSPPKTRIAAMWVQVGKDPNPAAATKPWDRYGVWLSESRINEILAKVHGGKSTSEALIALGMTTDKTAAKNFAERLLDLEQETHKESDHGTGVASIAAGTPWKAASGASLYGGVAPIASLVVACLSSNEEGNLADAVEFCFATADAASSPCVVNMSFGNYVMPRNGRTKFDQRVRSKLASGKKVLVASAGNAGAVYKHARASSPQTLTINVLSNLLHHFSIFVSAKAPVTLAIAPPNKPTGFLSSGKDDLDQEVVITPYVNALADTGAHQTLRVTGTPSGDPELGDVLESGTWTLKISGTSDQVDVWVSTHGFIDADNIRIMPIHPPAGSREDAGVTDPKLRRPISWIRSSLNGNNCGVDTISVGGVGQRRGGQVRFYQQSSRGQPVDEPNPARAAKDSKPDIAAPSQRVRVARWTYDGKNRMGLSTAMDWPNGGTSSAAPWVAGAVALMLSHDPALTQSKIRQILRDTASPHTDDDEWTALLAASDINPRDLVGTGTLDIGKAVFEVVKNNPP